MEIHAYGEDALTLWALKNKYEYILRELGDLSNPSKCQAFFRPSFGRRGGKNSSEFGEFDFILLTANHIYLGESKWDNSSEKIIDGNSSCVKNNSFDTDCSKFYIEKWAFGTYKENQWKKFVNEAKPKLIQEDIEKPIAPANSLLAENLQTALKLIREYYTDTGLPTIRNVLSIFP